MADNTAKDIRSVIKNATQGGIKREDMLGSLKKPSGVVGNGNTIATTEEINTQRVDNTLKNKPTIPTQHIQSQPVLKKAETNTDSVIQATKSTRDNGFPGGSIFASRNTDPNQINNSGEKINDVEINGERNGAQQMPSREITAGSINSRIPKAQEQAKRDMQIKLGNAVRDLYTTAYSKLQNGEYLTQDYVREKFPEFENLSDDDLWQLASDATYLAQQGDYNLQNAFELANAYGLDTALLFDELDPKTKGEYVTYLATQGGEEKSPGLFDRVIGLGLDRLGLGGDATFSDFLHSNQEEYNQARISNRDLEQANLQDLRNIFNSYRQYYKADEKTINELWKDIEKYYKGELGDGWFGNVKGFEDKIGGSTWFETLDKRVKWTDEAKREEFKKAFWDWNDKSAYSQLKNWGKNALYDLADLGIGAYDVGNHILDFAGGILQLGLGTVENTAQKLGAMPKDTYDKLESTGPVGEWFAGIMRNSENAADLIWDDYIIPTYGSLDNFAYALQDRPFSIASDFFSALELSLKAGAKMKVGNLGEKVPVNIGGKTVWKTRGWLAGEEIAKLDPMVWMGGAAFKADEAILKAPLTAAKGVLDITKWTADKLGVTNFITKLANQATGLTEEQRAFIRENPDLVQAYITGEKSIDDLTKEMIEKYGDERAQRMIAGDLFDFLKNSDQQLDTRGMFYKLTDAFDELGVKRALNGTLTFTKPLEESVKARIKKAYEYIDSISNSSASVNDVHWAREGIGGLTKWDAGHAMTPQESIFNAAMKDVYGTIGEVLKNQVKGWADADKAYTEISRILTDFKERFDKDGNLKDSAYSKISNLTNKNNKPKLERLLKYFPEFEKDIKALGAAKAVDRAMNATAGHYLNAALSGLGGGALFSLFTGGVGWGTIVAGILASNLLTPKNFVKVLKAEGGLRRLKGGIGQTIIDKLTNGRKLNAKESDTLYDYMVENKENLKNSSKKLEKQGKLEKLDKSNVLKELQQQKKDRKKLYEEGKVSKERYNQAIDKIDYDISQLETKYKAEKINEADKEKGSTEYEVSEKEKDKLKEKYLTPLEKKLGFREDTEAALKAEVENAEKEGGTVRGYAKIKEKLYALAKNPTSTTAQHEFFHAVFSVVDEKSARYILDEAKRIMKEYGMSDKNAEEWLAESFGTYAKRRDVNLGVLDKPTTAMGKFRAAINDLFQKAYEWLQNYNGDRKTINKMFNEILKDEWTLDANGKLDLSYLLNDKKPGGLRNKLGLESKANKKALSLSSKKGYNPSDLLEGGVKQKNAPRKPFNGGNGVVFKKDFGATKYKADINGKSVDIDTKATSPDQLAKINSEGLSVMKSFISEKQAKKALDVSKELLDDKGNPYLWTHTNKYTAQPFTAFENFGDSKYKEFVDKEIAWVTNNEYMSKSYANWDTILADTKPTTIKEINDKTLKTEKSKGVDVPLGKDKSLKANTTYENGEELIKNGDKYELVKRNKMVYEFDASVDKILDDIDVAKEGYTWDSAIGEEEKTHPLTKEERIERLKFRIGGSYSWGKYDVEVKELPNGKTQITKSWKDGEVLKSFDSKAAALADIKASNKGKSKYHYQGIVQDVKKPLVVDMKGEGGVSFWNRLGNAYDFLKKNDEAQLKKVEKAEQKLQTKIKSYIETRDSIYKEAEDLRREYNKRINDYRAEKPLNDPSLTPEQKQKMMDKINKMVEEEEWAYNAKRQIDDILNGKINDLHSGVEDWVAKHKDFGEIYNKALKFAADEGNFKTQAFIKKFDTEGALQWLRDNGVDDATISLFHKMWGPSGYPEMFSYLRELQRKNLQTNDYVFYALRKGGYDGVLFKNIVDYGAEPKGGWGLAEGGDVLAAFKSKNFKAWNNANPTDSKYISYKKDTGLKSKNGYRIDEDAKTPRKLIKDVNGLSEMTSFVSEKQAEMAHDVSKDLLSKDGNPYLWTHTNKYADKQFANFESTKDSKYKSYDGKEVAWFTNSKTMSDSYAEGKASLAMTKPFKSLDELRKYAKENPVIKKIGSAGNVKKEVKFEYDIEPSKANDGSDWWGLYSQKTETSVYPSLKRAWDLNREDWYGGDTLGEMPKDRTEALRKLKDRLGDVEIKELAGGKIEVSSKYDKTYIEGYDNEKQALAEGYANISQTKAYQYQGIITDMKKPYVVDFRDWGERGKQWNDLGTLKDFALAEGGEKITKAIKSVDNYESAKYDLIDMLENAKRALLDENGRYKEGNMIEDKDYFLTNIIRNIREGTVDTLLTDGAWKGDEFASIKNDKLGDNIYPHLTYGDLYEMLQPLKDNTGLGFMEDYGTLPEVLDKMGVKGNAYNLITKMLVENEYFKGAADYFKGGETPYAENIKINGIRDLIKKLNGIKLETNDFVKYALDDGNYDGVIFKNIRDYGGTPKEGWGQEKPADVAAIFHSRQFKAWDNANPTESKYISYKKDTKGLTRKELPDTDNDGRKLSEAQRKFFAGTKVVDKNGNLLRVYHGTRADFTVFDGGDKNWSNAEAKIGNRFTTSEKGAKAWAEQSWGKGLKAKAMGGYLDIKNPKVYEKWDTTEFLKKTEENRAKYIKDLNKFLDETGYNPLKEKSYIKSYFEDESKEAYKGQYRYQQREAIDHTLKELSYIKGTYDLDNFKYLYGTDRKEYVDRMRAKGMTDDQIKEISKQAEDWIKRWKDIDTEFRKSKFTDAYELFENDLHSFDGQTVQDRVGGGWMAMNDADKAIQAYKQSLIDQGYDGIIIKGTEYDGEVFGKVNDQYIAFNSNQFKNIDNLNPTKNEDIRFKKARHGSPADFDRFDSSHMGEGEGQQIHGWGHYAAIDKDVAKKHYAEMGALKYKDKQIGGYDNLISEIEDLPTDKKNMIQHIAYEVQKKGKTASEAKNDLINSYTKDIEQLKGFIDKNEKKLEQLKKAGKTSRVDYQGMINNAKRYIDRDNLLLTITKNLDENDFSKRNLYELEIPDPIKKDTPTGSNYWEEWDSNYTKEQIEKIGKELAKKIEGKPLEEATMKDVENIAKAMHNKLSPASQRLFVESVKEWVDKGHDIKTAIEDNIAYYTSLSSTADGWLEAAGLRPQGKYYDAIQLWRQGSQGRNIYTKISSILGSDKAASKFLESLGYDGIHYYGGRDGEAYVLFNDNAPQIQNHIRYKKDTNGLAKKDNGLRKKADIQQKTSSLGRHKSEIDSFARQLGVTGDTPLQKMKQMNKIIKYPKYQGTKIKKDLYALKWNIKKEYILDNNKKIKDRGPNNTKLVVWQNGEKATWHFIPSQYYELKRMGVLE